MADMRSTPSNTESSPGVRQACSQACEALGRANYGFFELQALAKSALAVLDDADVEKTGCSRVSYGRNACRT